MKRINIDLTKNYESLTFWIWLDLYCACENQKKKSD